MTSAIQGIARASELTSPALPNHFLQKSGRSDRISIDGATNEGSLTQTLQILNGATQKIVANPKETVIRKIVQGAETNGEKGALLFQSVLPRQPADQRTSSLRRGARGWTREGVCQHRLRSRLHS